MRMLKSYKTKIIIISGFLAAWIVLWVVFTARFIKQDLKLYEQVKNMTLDEKHSYILGEDVYSFLLFCKNKIPERANFMLEADLNVYKTSRFIYYMYPMHLAENADFIVVYKRDRFKNRSYTRFAVYDDSSYIMRRKR